MYIEALLDASCFDLAREVHHTLNPAPYTLPPKPETLKLEA